MAPRSHDRQRAIDNENALRTYPSQRSPIDASRPVNMSSDNGTRTRGNPMELSDQELDDAFRRLGDQARYPYEHVSDYYNDVHQQQQQPRSALPFDSIHRHSPGLRSNSEHRSSAQDRIRELEELSYEQAQRIVNLEVENRRLQFGAAEQLARQQAQPQPDRTQPSRRNENFPRRGETGGHRASEHIAPQYTPIVVSAFHLNTSEDGHDGIARPRNSESSSADSDEGEEVHFTSWEAADIEADRRTAQAEEERRTERTLAEVTRIRDEVILNRNNARTSTSDVRTSPDASKNNEQLGGVRLQRAQARRERMISARQAQREQHRRERESLYVEAERNLERLRVSSLDMENVREQMHRHFETLQDMRDVELVPRGEPISLTNHTSRVEDPPSGTQCAICQEEIGEDNDGRQEGNTEEPFVRTNACQHLFHEECLGHWVNGTARNRNTCPTCRTVICPARARGPRQL